MITNQEKEVFKLLQLVQGENQGADLKHVVALGEKVLKQGEVSLSEERRKRLSAWIGGEVSNKTYESACSNRHEGTCEWAANLSQIQAFHSTEPTHPHVLWIYAPPGFGKTVLSAWIINHLREQKTSPLSFFFCVADDQLTRDPYTILRSWLVQLLHQNGHIADAMDSVYQGRKAERLATPDGLWELFVAAGQAVENATFVVDGFDECVDIDTGAGYHRHEPRNLFLRDLLESLSKTKSRVLVVSRDVSDIREYLGEHDSNGDVGVRKQEYGITPTDNAADIRSFSKHIVERKLPKMNSDDQQDIAQHAARKSEGMFLLVAILERSLSPTLSKAELNKTLEETPLDIEEAYSREFERITQLPQTQKADAVMILRWTLFAVRPLQVKQLVEALAVSDQSLETYPSDRLPLNWHETYVNEEYVQERILGRCGSLLKLQASSTDSPLAEHTVHFVHFSVKEHLLNLSKTSSNNRWAEDLSLEAADAEHQRLSNVCLRYLTLRMFDTVPGDISPYPFLTYAAWAWYYHSFYKKPRPCQDIIAQTRKAFDPAELSWKVWTPVMEAELPEPEPYETTSVVASQARFDQKSASQGALDAKAASSDMLQDVQSPIYFASLLGLVDVVKWLEDQGLDVNSSGGTFGFPLQAAITRNHEDLVKHLLGRGVDVRKKGGMFGTALIAAAAMSTTDMVKTLLDAKSDLTATDQNGWTALHHAANRGNHDIVQLLIDKGADINAVTTDNKTPTELALTLRGGNVLHVLAEKGARIFAERGVSELVLEVGILTEDEKLVHMALNQGLQVNDVPKERSTALNLSVNSLRMVRLLLAKGANPNLADGDGITPLVAAVAVKNSKMIEALLKAGAKVDGDLDTAANELLRPLYIAILNDDQATVEMLFKHGAKLDLKTKGGVTAILLAVFTQKPEILEWLIDMGASMQCVWPDGQSSLFDLAAFGDGTSQTFDPSLEIMRLLVSRGCFRVRKQGIDKETRGRNSNEALVENTLVMLAFEGKHDAVRVALGRNPDPVEVCEALQVASAMGHLAVIQELLQSRPKVNLTDVNGRTALHHAAGNKHFDIAEILVDKGASMTIEDVIGSTPIDLAVSCGKVAAGFIRKNMNLFTFNISRRPSLLSAMDTHSSKPKDTAVRNALSGHWSGHYQYLMWNLGEKEQFSLDIPSQPPIGQPSVAFFQENKDLVGHFEFHGFVDSVGTVWFVKLYDRLGWLYRGQLDLEKGTFHGTWGKNRKLWFGSFHLSQ